VGTESFLRLVEAHESPLVRDVFADQILSRTVAVPPSIRDVYDYRRCVSPVALGLPPTAFGDADAILIERGKPQRASAVEFKRVKVTQASLVTEEINKLGELPKAVRQANALSDAGFAAVWLTVIVVADMRSPDGSALRFTPGKLVQRVKEAIPLSKLNPSVGVTVCEITQTSDRPANWRGGSVVRFYRWPPNAIKLTCLQPGLPISFHSACCPTRVAAVKQFFGLRAASPRAFMCAQHDNRLGGESPLGSWSQRPE